MHKLTLFILAAACAVALAEGQYYVPRAYYTIDAEGHESARVPLRRLRRSLGPYPYTSGSNANANANANAEALDGGSANANANAHASSRGWGGDGNGGRGGGSNGGWGGNGGWDGNGNGGWELPSSDGYGASRPLSAGMTRRQFGPVSGQSISASTSVDLDSSGHGYYDQSASVH